MSGSGCERGYQLASSSPSLRITSPVEILELSGCLHAQARNTFAHLRAKILRRYFALNLVVRHAKFIKRCLGLHKPTPTGANRYSTEPQDIPHFPSATFTHTTSHLFFYDLKVDIFSVTSSPARTPTTLRINVSRSSRLHKVTLLSKYSTFDSSSAVVSADKVVVSSSPFSHNKARP